MKYLLLLFFVAVMAADINAQSPKEPVRYKWKICRRAAAALWMVLFFTLWQAACGMPEPIWAALTAGTMPLSFLLAINI